MNPIKFYVIFGKSTSMWATLLHTHRTNKDDIIKPITRLMSVRSSNDKQRVFRWKHHSDFLISVWFKNPEHYPSSQIIKYNHLFLIIFSVKNIVSLPKCRSLEYKGKIWWFYFGDIDYILHYHIWPNLNDRMFLYGHYYSINIKRKR